MAAKAKQILITTESREVFIFRQAVQNSIQGFCPICGEDVEMMNLDTAVNQSGVGSRELIYHFDDGDVHSIETTTGHLLICKPSLKKKELKGD